MPFLMLALEGGEWSASRPGCFVCMERSPGCAPELVWLLWRRHESCDPHRNEATVPQMSSCL
jgi:hypothetical protein